MLHTVHLQPPHWLLSSATVQEGNDLFKAYECVKRTDREEDREREW